MATIVAAHRRWKASQEDRSKCETNMTFYRSVVSDRGDVEEIEDDDDCLTYEVLEIDERLAPGLVFIRAAFIHD